MTEYQSGMASPTAVTSMGGLRSMNRGDVGESGSKEAAWAASVPGDAPSDERRASEAAVCGGGENEEEVGEVRGETRPRRVET